ncbi:hypothetical protein [Amycolatopsis thermoflava]|uniref:hypothetical protein n=1 Tax=Amycolatopsis thermoflava TaxID=84480 RepID=UPI003659654B
MVNWRDWATDKVEFEPEELRAWAYDPDAQEPYEDWDLMISDVELGPTLVELVADPNCPHREYLLGVLYILSGDAVRTEYWRASRADLEEVVRRAEQTSDQWVMTWARRTRALIAAPEMFEYYAWCDHGLARRPVDD